MMKTVPMAYNDADLQNVQLRTCEATFKQFVVLDSACVYIEVQLSRSGSLT